jgi:hypothetical protein
MAPKTEKRYMIWVVYRFLGHKMTSNEKSLNYKVIDLVESYNFYINFIFIRVHTKNYDFLKELNPTAISHGVCRRYITRTCKRRTTQRLEHCSTSNRRIVWHLNPNTMWYGGSSIVLQNLKLVIYFWKKRKKIHILRSMGLKSYAVKSVNWASLFRPFWHKAGLPSCLHIQRKNKISNNKKKDRQR